MPDVAVARRHEAAHPNAGLARKHADSGWPEGVDEASGTGSAATHSAGKAVEYPPGVSRPRTFRACRASLSGCPPLQNNRSSWLPEHIRVRATNPTAARSRELSPDTIESRRAAEIRESARTSDSASVSARTPTPAGFQGALLNPTGPASDPSGFLRVRPSNAAGWSEGVCRGSTSSGRDVVPYRSAERSRIDSAWPSRPATARCARS